MPHFAVYRRNSIPLFYGVSEKNLRPRNKNPLRNFSCKGKNGAYFSPPEVRATVVDPRHRVNLMTLPRRPKDGGGAWRDEGVFRLRLARRASGRGRGGKPGSPPPGGERPTGDEGNPPADHNNPSNHSHRKFAYFDNPPPKGKLRCDNLE